MYVNAGFPLSSYIHNIEFAYAFFYL